MVPVAAAVAGAAAAAAALVVVVVAAGTCLYGFGTQNMQHSLTKSGTNDPGIQ